MTSDGLATTASPLHPRAGHEYVIVRQRAQYTRARVLLVRYGDGTSARAMLSTWGWHGVPIVRD